MAIRLPERGADELASRILSSLRERLGSVGEEKLDWAAFHAFRRQVRQAFDVPETSVTPLMARVLWGISTLARPQSLLVLGCYAGNTLVWLASPVFSEARRIVGVDIATDALELARRNFARLGTPGVALVAGDAEVVIPRLGGTFDLVFIDVDHPVRRKAPYRALLDAVEPFLPPGGMVLAHDICVEKFRDDLQPYLAAVRDQLRFRVSIPLEIDACGLEVSVRG